jgi:hypothetical protein
VPVLTWQPSDKKIEPELWKQVESWQPGTILWLVSPDQKTREPILYKDKKTHAPISPKQLEEALRAAAKKHNLKFIEPK